MLREPKIIYVLFAFGIVLLVARLLLSSSFSGTALMYLLLPLIVAVLLFHLTGPATSQNILPRLAAHLRDATVWLFLTAGFLQEGFICVLMFMPIYFGVAIIVFFFMWLYERSQSNRGKLSTCSIPLVLVLMSLEGVLPATTFDRDHEVVQTRTVDLSIAELKDNMALPIEFPEERHWFLSVFPLPEEVEAGSLVAGDIHTLRFVYKRWFFTNTHRGEMLLKISNVQENLVRTEVVANTSYLANYLKIKGTEVAFTDLGDDRTQIALTVRYKRLLDPYWYFGPMQHLAVSESAKFLIDSVIVRARSDV